MAMNKLFSELKPDFTARSVESLTPELFAEGMPLQDVKAVAYDVDGTLMNHHAKSVEHVVYSTLKAQAEAGLRLYVISNAYGDKRRSELYEMFEMNGLGMKVFTPEDVAGRALAKRNRKPSPAMLHMVREELDESQIQGDILMVGDQMAKDVWSARRAGVMSVLVPRRGEGDDWRVRSFQRPAELGLRAIYGMPLRASDYSEAVTAA